MPGIDGAENANDEFSALFRGWLQAAEAHDGSWFLAHLADDFRYLHAAGGTASRDELIAANVATRNSSYELRWAEACRYGDVLVGHGVYSGRGELPREAPRPMIESYAAGVELRFSCTWVERDGDVRCVLMQTTPVVDSSAS